MKIKLTLLLFWLSVPLFAQQKCVSKSIHFDKAYNEIAAMLATKQTISLKQAIFLTENAYYDGKLDWNWYDSQLNNIVKQCKTMISEKGLPNTSTSATWAIFGYMAQKIPHNNFQPYTYDYDNFMGEKDMQSQFVYNLLKFKKGNCHSLPLLYLILAQELGAEAYLVLAPMHLFIKHKDQYGEWWNLELTSGSYSRTAFIIESFKITDKQIQTGFYMKALDKKEILAYLLEDLFAYYDEKYKIYYDDFVLNLVNTGLKYLPISNHIVIKVDVVKYKLDADMAKVGLSDYDKIAPYPNLVKQKQTLDKLRKRVIATGFKPVSEEWYKKMVQENFQKKQ